MRPQYIHEVVGNKTQTARFMSDICFPAANELAGGSFMRYPYDEVVRSQQTTLDAYEQDYARIGFSALKIRQEVDGPVDSVNFNFWAYVSMYPQPEAIWALQTENAEAVEAYYEEHPEKRPSEEDTMLFGDTDFDDTVDETEVEVTTVRLDGDYDLKIYEKLDYYVNSKVKQPIKQRRFEYDVDGNTLGEITYTKLFPMRWLGETPQEQAALTTLAENYISTFDYNDIRTMIGILGRLGLIDKDYLKNVS